MSVQSPIELLEQVAAWFDDVGVAVVYTGGTTVPLYLAGVAATEFRATKDVDCVVDTRTYAAYAELLGRLRRAGFHETSEEGAPICRLVRSGLSVDVMPVVPDVLGFSNEWYADGWDRAATVALPSGRSVRVFPVEYVLASKVAAYESRGGGDAYGSHDMEDIITLLDGSPGVLDAVEQSDERVRAFLVGWLAALARRRDAYDVLAAHVSRAPGDDDRAFLLLERLAAITDQ